MEAVALEALEIIVELAVEELCIAVIGSKCCRASKKKWDKVLKRLRRNKEDRQERVLKKINSVSSDVKKDVMEYAHKIGTLKITQL